MCNTRGEITLQLRLAPTKYEASKVTPMAEPPKVTEVVPERLKGSDGTLFWGTTTEGERGSLQRAANTMTAVRQSWWDTKYLGIFFSAACTGVEQM
jgi:hypothetical protein